jgi:tetratricopeptide (TPR) repeat protein
LAIGPPKENYARAKVATLKALELDDTLGEAHAQLAEIRAIYEWDLAGAEREFHRALELNPNYAATHFEYGRALAHERRFVEAINEEKRAVELDPLSLPNNRALGAAFYYARQYDQAIEQGRKTLELDPNFTQAHTDLGLDYIQKSMFQESIAETEKALAISPGNSAALLDIGYAYAVAGRKAEAQKVLDQLNERSKQKYISPRLMARLYVGLGEKDKAFAYLERSYKDRSIAFGFGTINVDPTFDPLRSDPRFQDLLRRMNLQP